MGGKERKGRFTARMMVNFWTAYSAEFLSSILLVCMLSHVAVIDEMPVSGSMSGSIGQASVQPSWYRPLCRTGVASCVAMV